MTARGTMRLDGRVAVITGAGSGIGRAIAASLASRGARLALVDRDEAGLAETVRTIGGDGRRVTAHPLDVTDREAIRALPDAVAAAHGSCDLLFNNAGVALQGTFAEVREEDFDWLISINFDAVVRLTRDFLPHLMRSDDARLVFTSSVYGLIAPPRQAAYAASKFAVRGFANALGHELAGTQVGVTTIHPGGVATKIARNARATGTNDPADIERHIAAVERSLRLSPATAGEIIVRGVERRRRRILVGTDARIIAAIERLAPVRYWEIIRRMNNR